jgi:predicted nucleic acid-binding protein
MPDKAFAAVFGVHPEQITQYQGGHGVEIHSDDIHLSPIVLKEFVRLSVKNHGPTMRKISENARTVDDKLMKKLYKSFVKHLDDDRVARLLEKNRQKYGR